MSLIVPHKFGTFVVPGPGLDIGLLGTTSGYSTASEGICNKTQHAQKRGNRDTQLRRLTAFRERDR